MKIIEYITLNPSKNDGYGIAYRLYDYAVSTEKHIESGFFFNAHQLTEYADTVTADDMQNVTYTVSAW